MSFNKLNRVCRATNNVKTSICLLTPSYIVVRITADVKVETIRRLFINPPCLTNELTNTHRLKTPLLYPWHIKTQEWHSPYPLPASPPCPPPQAPTSPAPSLSSQSHPSTPEASPPSAAPGEPTHQHLRGNPVPESRAGMPLAAGRGILRFVSLRGIRGCRARSSRTFRCGLCRLSGLLETVSIANQRGQIERKGYCMKDLLSQCHATKSPGRISGICTIDLSSSRCG